MFAHITAMFSCLLFLFSELRTVSYITNQPPKQLHPSKLRYTYELKTVEFCDGLDGLGSIFGSVRFFSSQRPDRIWGPPNLVSNAYKGLISRGNKAAGA